MYTVARILKYFRFACKTIQFDVVCQMDFIVKSKIAFNVYKIMIIIYKEEEEEEESNQCVIWCNKYIGLIVDCCRLPTTDQTK